MKAVFSNRPNNQYQIAAKAAFSSLSLIKLGIRELTFSLYKTTHRLTWPLLGKLDSNGERMYIFVMSIFS
jgi:hypothetical protein